MQRALRLIRHRARDYGVRLDRIAFSRGRFALEGTTGALTLPVQSEIGRAIEDCRG